MSQSIEGPFAWPAVGSQPMPVAARTKELRIVFIAMSGLRACDPELTALGLPLILGRLADREVGQLAVLLGELGVAELLGLTGEVGVGSDIGHVEEAVDESFRSERRTQQWFKMVNPPGEARDDAWQVIAVARKLFDRGHLGMRDKDGRFLFHMTNAQGAEVPVWDFRRYYDVNVDQQLFEEYRRFSRYKHKDLAPYGEYVKARGLRWPVVEQADHTWRETRFRFSKFDDPYATKADIQFYHSVTKDDRALIWFHPWEAPPESPDADYPL